MPLQVTDSVLNVSLEGGWGGWNKGTHSTRFSVLDLQKTVREVKTTEREKKKKTAAILSQWTFRACTSSGVMRRAGERVPYSWSVSDSTVYSITLVIHKGSCYRSYVFKGFITRHRVYEKRCV